jgi:hypothetical protein
MTEIWLGVVLILGIAFLLLGFVGLTVFVVIKGSEWWLDRRQARRFAEAVARGEFEQAENRCAESLPITRHDRSRRMT